MKHYSDYSNAKDKNNTITFSDSEMKNKEIKVGKEKTQIHVKQQMQITESRQINKKAA